ncbi:hypothetical protein ACLBKS_08365 [Hylemonella sp. W303a]|uniref:hypothetical protein n=1 Tax=Hylemonella sp. W303a TaxID=3389873 RepID=UPI00396B4215
MRNAPSVSYPVGRSFLRTLVHGGVLAFLWLVGAVWVTLLHSDEAGRWLMVFACLLVTLPLAWTLIRPERGRVRWDGQDWFWAADTQVAAEDLLGKVHVRLDWQSGMLLEFIPMSQSSPSPADGATIQRPPGLSGRTRWLWVERAQAPAYWNALRRAAWADAGHPSKAPA